MNIAIVYHYDPNKEDIWGTPQGIERGLKLNNKVDKYLLDPKKCNFDSLIDNSKKYDLILFFYAGPSDSFDLELLRLRNNNIYKSKGYNSYWMTHWCDESIFYYNKEVPRENNCITTCGDRPPYTNVLPKFLNKRFINKKVDNAENNAFYNSGTVVFQYARWDEITRRIFEGGGCKNAVITNRISKETGIYDLFKEDEDICYYSNETECISKINKLLHDEEYRNKLANNLYKKVTENHLVKNRIDLFLEALRK